MNAGTKLLLVIATLVPWVALASAGEDDGLRAFKRAFRASRKPVEAIEPRTTALAGLRGGSAKVARALFDAHRVLEGEAVVIETERRERLLGNGRKNAKLQRREALDPLREFQQGIELRLLGLADPEAVQEVVERALQDENLPFSLRLAVGRTACLPSARAMPLIGEALSSRDAATVAVALQALRAGEELSRELTPLILAQLGSRSAPVRELCAELLARLARPEGVEPLIRQMALEEGITRRRLTESLEILTRQPLGERPGAWRKWWADSGEAVLAGEVELGGGKPSPKTQDRAQYHGIPISGESILYALDRSKSMRVLVNGEGKGPLGPDPPEDPAEERRFDRAKRELVKALGELPEHKTFNLVVFAAGANSYSPEMVQATPREVEAAQRWVRELTMEFGTAMYDGIDLGFALGGRPVEDELHELGFDTLFLLTDGAPTRPLPTGKAGLGADSTKTILSTVGRWNLFGRVTVHTIGLGTDIRAKFLRNLAKQNGGEFVHEK